jgi:tetratricopeptide (TPR) repeat protein
MTTAAQALDQAESPPLPRDISPRTFLIGCAVLIALALALRLFHLHQIRPIPLFDHLIGDANSYDQWAQRIAGGEWLSGREVFYQAPLYPYFLAVVYKVSGHGLMATRVVQAIVGSLACGLLAMAGREFFGARVGLVAGTLLAIYPTAIFFDGVIQKSVLDVLLVCLLLYLAGAAFNRPSTARWIGLGGALGLLMLTRENAGVLAIPLLLWAWLAPRTPHVAPRAKTVALVIAGLAVVLFPVALRNAIVGGEFHLTTSQLGPNLYIGNNPHANGAYVPLVYGHASPAQERRDATELAEHALQRSLTPGEVSDYWIDRVKQFIRDDPEAWMALMRAKFVLFWNSTELGDTEDQYAYADWSRILHVLNPVLTFGLLTAAATIGIALTVLRWRRMWLLWAIVLLYAASVITFYVMARYRYPVVPLLILFAAAALVQLFDAARGKSRIEGWAVFLCLLVATAIFLATRPISNDMVRATTYMNIGRVLDEDHQLDEAFAYYSRARDLWPNDALLNVLLGRIRLDQQRPAEALPYFDRAIQIAPEHAPAYVAYGAGLLASGQSDAAAKQFERALALDPTNERARDGLRQARAKSTPSSPEHRFGL